MKIVLKEMTLSNFKGIRNKKIEFSPSITNIYGQNGTGKTTLKDAFLWLFFGKDSTDRSNFEIKTLDENNEPYHRLDHSVEAILVIDDETVEVSRVFREKWTKKTGSNTPEFTGHTTDFYWNDVPMKEKDFVAKVNGIVNEGTFKMITNTGFFNETMKWQDRRSVLLQLAGTIDNSQIFSRLAKSSLKADYEALEAMLTKKSVEEYKSELAAKKKILRDKLATIPERIDEAHKSLPESYDYAQLEQELKTLQDEMASVEDLLSNKSLAQQKDNDRLLELQREAYAKSSRINEIAHEEKDRVKDKQLERQQAVAQLRRDLNTANDKHTATVRELMDIENQLSTTLDTQAKERAKWYECNEEVLVFNEHDFSCPTCNRAFDQQDVDAKKQELTENFNKTKSEKLQQITAQGTKLAQLITSLQVKKDSLSSLKEDIAFSIKNYQVQITEREALNTELLHVEESEIQKAIDSNEEIKTLKQQLTLINEQIAAPRQPEDNTELKNRKYAIQQQIDQVKASIASKEQRNKTVARIAELEEQEKTMAQELSSLEKAEHCIQQFTQTKMDELENRINGMFKLVTFKLFKQNVNGTLEETCEALINGVPYSDANTASKINAGLDVINIISQHYGKFAPIFIDNRESVLTIQPSFSQIINLIVKKGEKELQVETEIGEMAMA